MNSLANFQCQVEKYFILESKIAELNQNKNSKKHDRPDIVRELCLILEMNE